MQPTPAAGDQRFLLLDIARIELPFVEGAFDHDRLEIVGDDELREHRVAADVALAGRVQRFGIELADHVAQIEIAIGEVFHVAAANVAEIAFFALGHRSRRQGVRHIFRLNGPAQFQPRLAENAPDPDALQLQHVVHV